MGEGRGVKKKVLVRCCTDINMRSKQRYHHSSACGLADTGFPGGWEGRVGVGEGGCVSRLLVR